MFIGIGQSEIMNTIFKGGHKLNETHKSETCRARAWCLRFSSAGGREVNVKSH